jgi:integrase
MGDVDFNGKFLMVRRSVVRGRIGTPKSQKARRVDMSSQLAEVLYALKEVRELEAIADGHSLSPDAWVFLSPQGCRLDERNLETAWAGCLARSGIRKVRFHDLRHTFASLLIQHGAHPKYIQEQLGHSSIQVTMDTYDTGSQTVIRDGWISWIPANRRKPHPFRTLLQGSDERPRSMKRVNVWNYRRNYWRARQDLNL